MRPDLPPAAVRRVRALHRGASLICTAFLLVICITGLPLIFEDEIERWCDPLPYAVVGADAPPVPALDDFVAKALDLYPGLSAASVFVDDDEPKVVVQLVPSWRDWQEDRRTARFVSFDARTGHVLRRSAPGGEATSFISLMRRLHTDLFGGLAGELFLGAMALIFAVSIITGVLIYGTFMRRLDFGTVRRGNARLQWLDLHNLLGIATVLWALVLGLTGLANELTTPLFGLWRQTEAHAILAPWRDTPAPSQAALAPVQRAFDAARAAVPGMIVTSLIVPGHPYGSPQHYLVWAKGVTPLTARLFNPVLVDARTGTVLRVISLPWYLRALELSRPLHFGNYGGLPLKIIWALLDLVTIVVLGSGIHLWIRKRMPRSAIRVTTAIS